MCGVAIDLVLDTKGILETSWHSSCISAWRIVTSHWIQFSLNADEKKTNFQPNDVIMQEYIESLFILGNITTSWLLYFIYQSKQNIILRNIDCLNETVSRGAQYSGNIVIRDNVSNLISYALVTANTEVKSL